MNNCLIYFKRLVSSHTWSRSWQWGAARTRYKWTHPRYWIEWLRSRWRWIEYTRELFVELHRMLFDLDYLEFNLPLLDWSSRQIRNVVWDWHTRMRQFDQICHAKHSGWETKRVHDISLVANVVLTSLYCLKRFVQHWDYREIKKIKILFFRQYSIIEFEWFWSCLDHFHLCDHTIGTNDNEISCYVIDRCFRAQCIHWFVPINCICLDFSFQVYTNTLLKIRHRCLGNMKPIRAQ